jgi:hypothetical protein
MASNFRDGGAFFLTGILPRKCRMNQKKGPGIARARITAVGGSVAYAACQNPISVLP